MDGTEDESALSRSRSAGNELQKSSVPPFFFFDLALNLLDCFKFGMRPRPL